MDDEPATRDRFDAVGAKLDARFDQVLEAIRGMQTEVLRAFRASQDTFRVQFRELEVNTNNSIQAVNARMDAIERRLTEIERSCLD